MPIWRKRVARSWPKHTILLATRAAGGGSIRYLAHINIGQLSPLTYVNKTGNISPRRLRWTLPNKEAENRILRNLCLLLNMNMPLLRPAQTMAFAYYSEIILIVFVGHFVKYSWMRLSSQGFPHRIFSPNLSPSSPSTRGRLRSC